jgi:hypothetical protein
MRSIVKEKQGTENLEERETRNGGQELQPTLLIARLENFWVAGS